MGDNFSLDGLSCPYCLERQDDVWYAESSNATTHICSTCGKVSEIVMTFVLKKIDNLPTIEM